MGWEVVGDATDERGNRTFFHERFSVLNAKNGICPGSLATELKLDNLIARLEAAPA